MISIRNGRRFNIYASAEIDGVRYANFTDPAIRHQLGISQVDEPAAPEDFSYDTHTRQELDDAPYVVYERKPQAEIDALMLAKAKQLRKEAVSAITVTTASGKEFDGDEDSQNRMSRAISAMGDGDETQWVLADNSVVTATKAELKEALRLAGAAMTTIWMQPYQ